MSKPHDGYKSGERDPDIANVETALRRAALGARERARKAGLKVPVYRHGQIVEELPGKIRGLEGTGPDCPDPNELDEL